MSKFVAPLKSEVCGMDSKSTIFIKPPDEIQSNRHCSEQPTYKTGLSFFTLWVLEAFATTAKIDPNAKMSGVSIILKLHDLVTTLLTTLVLSISFSTGNPYLAIPWIACHSWNFYKNQYLGFWKLYRAIKKGRTISKMAWIAIGTDAIAIITKAILIVRIAQLAINMWYQNKLQYETINK